MGGGRNGRYMKWLVALLVFLGTVYVFYQYRGLSSSLREKEEELERLEDLQSRLGDQLKGLYCSLLHGQWLCGPSHLDTLI